MRPIVSAAVDCSYSTVISKTSCKVPGAATAAVSFICSEKGRDRFSHTCAGRQLLRIDFAGDTAAPAGRLNIEGMYIT